MYVAFRKGARNAGKMQSCWLAIYPTCCPLVRFSHIGSIKDAARDGPCAHGKLAILIKYKLLFHNSVRRTLQMRAAQNSARTWSTGVQDASLVRM